MSSRNFYRQDRVYAVALILIIGLAFLPTDILSVSAQSARLERSLQEVHSMEPVLVYAYFPDEFNSIELQITTDVDTSTGIAEDIGIPDPPPLTIKLPMVPLGYAPNWYVAGIIGLPADSLVTSILGGAPAFIRTISFTITIVTNVQYSLIVDGSKLASGSYTVLEGTRDQKVPPLVSVVAYDTLNDRSAFEETLGLGPKGWTWDSKLPMKVLVMVADDRGVAGITQVNLEYSVNGSPSWKKVRVDEEPSMGVWHQFGSDMGSILGAIKNAIREIEPSFTFQNLTPPVLMGNAIIPPQSDGQFVSFRGAVIDVDDNSAVSPVGLFYSVNRDFTQRILIVDPHVKEWVLQENVVQFGSVMRQYSDFKVPSDLISVVTSTRDIAGILKESEIVPFHHWEYLGGNYDLRIHSPDIKLKEQLRTRSQGGFEPAVIILSNLWLGSQAGGIWNSDLKEIGVLDDLINYIKATNAGLIATHGTLSDWQIWRTCGEQQSVRVGSRGHVGSSLGDVSIEQETSIAGLLGIPHLAVWEAGRDAIAGAVCSTRPSLGNAVGSIPLQITNVPFDGSMSVTGDMDGIDWTLPQNFTIRTPGVQQQVGLASYTQAGWQLAMPVQVTEKSLGRIAASGSSAKQTFERIAGLLADIEGSALKNETVLVTSSQDALSWGLRNFYDGVVSSTIQRGSMDLRVSVEGVEGKIAVILDLQGEFQKLLTISPPKLIAVSDRGEAGILAYDKSWDRQGYRSVYFSIEPEASDGFLARQLLTESVRWSLNWQYKETTTLLGDLVRVSKETADEFRSSVQLEPGVKILSEGILLNGKGGSTLNFFPTETGRSKIIIAHPTSNGVSLELIEGNGKVSKQKSDVRSVSTFVFEGQEGAVTLAISSRSESSFNPAFVEVMQLTAGRTPIGIPPPQEPKPEPGSGSPSPTTPNTSTSQPVSLRSVADYSDYGLYLMIIMIFLLVAVLTVVIMRSRRA